MKKLLKLCIVLSVFLLLLPSCGRSKVDIPYGYVDGCQLKITNDLREWVNEDQDVESYLVRIYVYDLASTNFERPDKEKYLTSDPVQESESDLLLFLLEEKKSQIAQAEAEQNKEKAEQLKRELADLQERYDNYEDSFRKAIRDRYQFMLDWLAERGAPAAFDMDGIDYENYKKEYILAAVTKEDIIDLYLEPGEYYYKINKEFNTKEK